MEYVKKFAYLILIIIGSFLGVQVGPAIGIDGARRADVQVTGHVCGIKLDGASAKKRAMASMICDTFGRISDEQATEILNILESCGDAN